MERIICSAIWFKDLPLKRGEVLDNKGFGPYNVDRGIVLGGWRHSNCIYQMVAIYGMKMHEVGESVQGFLTNKNRFVDRLEGRKIAIKAKQVNESDVGGILFSEDLY